VDAQLRAFLLELELGDPLVLEDLQNLLELLQVHSLTLFFPGQAAGGGSWA
jgi:hypothetical protein